MLIPIPVFIRNIFERSQRDREIDAHIISVNARVSIEHDAEFKFQEAYGKLTEEQKKNVEDYSEKFLRDTHFIFPRRSDYLDFKRYRCQELIKDLEDTKGVTENA